MIKRRNVVGLKKKWFLNSFGSFVFEGPYTVSNNMDNEVSLKTSDFLERQTQTDFINDIHSKDYKKFIFCKKYFSPKVKLVDISAAPGLVAEYAIKTSLLTNERVICTEYSNKFAEELQVNNNIDWRVLDLSSSDSQSLFFNNLSSKIDLWIMWYSIYYSKDIKALFENIATFSTPGSKIIIATPKPTLGTVLNFGKEKLHPINFPSKEELVHFAQKNKFNLIHVKESERKFSIRPNTNSIIIRWILRFFFDLIVHTSILIANKLHMKGHIKNRSDILALKSSDLFLVFEKEHN